MFIPGFLISIATFPGVVVHELAHVVFCKFTDTRVLKVCYFRVGNPAGYVIHEPPSTVWRHILIGVGPFFVNTLLGFMLGIIAIPMHMDWDHPTPVQLLLLWLGVSIAMHSFPSTGDARSIWHAVWSKGAPISARLIGSPLVIVIFAGAIGSILWLDALYGVGVVAAAGARQKASQRDYAAMPRSTTNTSVSRPDFDPATAVPVQDTATPTPYAITSLPAAGQRPPADSFVQPADSNSAVDDARWMTRRCEDVSLDTPFSFQRNPNVFADAPQLTKILTGYDVYTGHSASGTCVVTVSRLVYRPTTRTNLDGAVEGAVRGAINGVLGDTTPDYKSVHTRVDGMDARRAIWYVTESGQKYTLDGLFVLRDHTLWQIQVIHTPDSPKSDVERILSSVHINPLSTR
ncbi:MAG TPA: DUF3267 domain-containing protein [Chthoniobacterales bacterium]